MGCILRFRLKSVLDKTNVYDVLITYNHEDALLGVVKWHGGWRQYCFFAEDDVMVTAACMETITKFIKKLKRGF